MIQEWFANNIFMYILLGICGVGMLVKFLISMRYRFLIRASQHMGVSKNKLMKEIRLKFETRYTLQLGVNNVDIFVDKYVQSHRFCGIYLYTWEMVSGEILLLELIATAVFAVLGIFNQCGLNQILYTSAIGVLGAALLITYEFFINLSMKRQVLKTNLRDYLENFLKSRLESNEKSNELLEQYKKEYFDLPGKQKKVSSKVVGDENSSVTTLSKREKRRQDKLARAEAKREEKLAKKQARKKESRGLNALADQEDVATDMTKRDPGLLRREAKKNELKEMIQADKHHRDKQEKDAKAPKEEVLVGKVESTYRRPVMELPTLEEPEKETIDERLTKSYARERRSSLRAVHATETKSVARLKNQENRQIKEVEKEAAASKVVGDEVISKDSHVMHSAITEEEAKVIEDILREFLS